MEDSKPDFRKTLSLYVVINKHCMCSTRISKIKPKTKVQGRREAKSGWGKRKKRERRERKGKERRERKRESTHH